MAIEITCLGCGKVLHAPEAAAGKKGKCPHCGSILQVPTVKEVPSTEAALESQRPNEAPPTSQKSVPQEERKPSRRTALAIGIGIASLCALLLVAFVLIQGMHWGLFGISREVTSKNAEAVLPFRIKRVEDGHGGAAWVITNASDKPLVIERVSFNGEYDARLADRFMLVAGSIIMEDATAKPPVTLAIGERAVFVEWEGESRHGYPKTIIYIDFLTNKGQFRYRP